MSASKFFPLEVCEHLQCLVMVGPGAQPECRAAKALALTQPAVSKTIAELEDIVGRRLLLRRRRGVELTPAADVLVRHAVVALRGLREGLGLALDQTRARPVASGRRRPAEHGGPPVAGGHRGAACAGPGAARARGQRHQRAADDTAAPGRDRPRAGPSRTGLGDGRPGLRAALQRAAAAGRAARPSARGAAAPEARLPWRTIRSSCRCRAR